MRTLLLVLLLLSSFVLSAQISKPWYQFNQFGVRASGLRGDSVVIPPALGVFPTLPATYGPPGLTFSTKGAIMMYTNPTDSTPANWPYWYNGTNWFTLRPNTYSNIFDTACNGFVKGGKVTEASELCYSVDTAWFRINCKQYKAWATDTLCLETYPVGDSARFDVFYADTLGGIHILKGVTSLFDPVIPQVNQTWQYALTAVLLHGDSAIVWPLVPNYVHYGKNANGVTYGDYKFRYLDTPYNLVFIGNADFAMRENNNGKYRLKVNGLTGMNGSLLMNEALQTGAALQFESFGYGYKRIWGINNQGSINITGATEVPYESNSGRVRVTNGGTNGDWLNFVAIYDSATWRPEVQTHPITQRRLNQYIFDANSTRRALRVPALTTEYMGKVKYNYLNANSGYGTLTEGMIAYDIGKRQLAYSRDTGWVYLDAGGGIGSETDPLAWKLLGNSGTTASTNFVGTTDNVELRFRTNNVERFGFVSDRAEIKTYDPNVNSAPGGGFYVNAGNGTSPGSVTYPGANIGISGGHLGGRALQALTGGYWNVAIGDETLNAVTTGAYNIGIGYRALKLNNSTYNVGIGAFALEENTSLVNTAVGWEAGRYFLGSNSVGVGHWALHGNNGATGYGVVAVGTESCLRCEDYNVGVGYRALTAGYTPAADNGAYAVANNLQGLNYNVQVGAVPDGVTGGISDTADYSIAIGYFTGWEGITGSSNNVIGAGGAGNNNWGLRVNGSNNNIFGSWTGNYVSGSSWNIAIGNYLGNPGGIGGSRTLNIGNVIFGENMYNTASVSSTPVVDGRIGIGTNNPNNSAILHLTSTTMGFLPPVMTGSQQNAIASPAAGLLIYNTDSVAHTYWNGSIWLKYGGGGTGGGTTETASNVGTGAGWYKTKVVNDLQFKSFKVAAGSGTTLTQNTDDITINPNSWYVTGNSDIVSLTNFLGTTNAVPLELRYNNSMRGWLSDNNVLFGSAVSSITLSNTQNTVAIGSLVSATVGWGLPQYTTAVGHNNFGTGTTTANFAATTNNIAFGNYNYSFTSNAGSPTLLGSYNTAVGTSNFRRAAAGSVNVAIGTNTTSWMYGSNNVLIGRDLSYSDLYANSIYVAQGLNNNVIGAYSLGYGIATDYNNVIGTQTATYFTDADNNLVIGYRGLWGNLSGPTPNLLDNASWTGTGWTAGANNYTWTHVPGTTTAKVNATLRAQRYQFFDVTTVVSGRTAGSVTLRFSNVWPEGNLTYSANGTFTSGGVNVNSAGDTLWHRVGADYEASANPPVNFELQPTSDFDGTVSIVVRERRATTVSSGIYIGNNTKAYQKDETGALVIGNNAISRGSNTATIGSSTITSTKLYGTLNLDGYGTGAKTGTPTYQLQVDASGNIIEGALGGGSGEANTASNLGGGTGVFAQKSGVDLQFKSLVQGSNITITNDANTVTISAAAGATDLSYTAATRLLESSTGADVTLPLFSSTDAGLTPASGGGTTNFLRADGSFANPITADITTNTGTQTLTNKRITTRLGTTTSSATPTINTDNVDMYTLTAQTVDITSMTTNLSGTPTDGQRLTICITGTASRAITWGTSFEASSIALPTTTSGTNMLCCLFIWNPATSKWRLAGTW